MSVIKPEHAGRVMGRRLLRPNRVLIRKYLGESK